LHGVKLWLDGIAMPKIRVTNKRTAQEWQLSNGPEPSIRSYLMPSLNAIIELFAGLVIIVSIPGTIYFIVRIIANRGRWNGETYDEQDVGNMPRGKGITPPSSEQEEKLIAWWRD
jgi:hypothetical protein